MRRQCPPTTHEIRRRLSEKFGGRTGYPEHLVLFEVGARQNDWKMRRIDAVAVGMTKRSGHLIHGFEIKVSRGDLLGELREPRKSSGQRFCDRWWLALASIDLLKPTDVIPEHWGIIVCASRGLETFRQPTPVARIESPEFRAALLHASQRSPGYRRAMGYQAGHQRALVEQLGRVQDAYRRGVTMGRIAARAEQEGVGA